MLATLPPAEDLVTEQGISASTREAIAAVVTTIYACRSDRIAFKTAGYTITGSILIVAVTLWMWKPLVGVLSVASIPLLRKWLTTRRLTGAKEETRAVLRRSDFQQSNYLELVARLDWEPISISDKEKFLAAVRAAV